MVISRFPLITCAIIVLICPPASPRTNEGHDGDWNIFPGNAIALTADRNIEITFFGRGYLGDLVPPEDSDRLPRLTRPWVLDFTIDGEKFRFTHSFGAVSAACDCLIGLIRHQQSESPSTSGKRFVHIAFYSGSSFRDRIARVSQVD